MVFTVAKKKAKPTRFGLRLRAVREAAGLTQVQLGERAEMPQIIISRLETSPKTNPTLATIEKLAAALGVPPADLLADDGG